MPITIKTLNDPKSDIQYTDALFKLDQAMREVNAAPHLYPKDRDFYYQSLAGNCYNVLAFANEEIVGYAALRKMTPWPSYLNPTDYPTDCCALMLINMVAPKWRGKGLSKQLNNGRLELARQNGFRYLFATVHPDNKPSISSLESVGFRVIEQRPMFQEQLLRNLMFLDLSAAMS